MCIGQWHHILHTRIKQYYAAGEAEVLPRNVDADNEDIKAEDVNIYFEDAAYRPSYISRLYNGMWEDFQPNQVYMFTQM